MPSVMVMLNHSGDMTPYVVLLPLVSHPFWSLMASCCYRGPNLTTKCLTKEVDRTLMLMRPSQRLNFAP